MTPAGTPAESTAATTAGLVCLQGGAEATPGCAQMDAELLRLVEGPVVVSGLAAPPGPDYVAATGQTVAHLQSLGAGDGRSVTGAPDARQDPSGALAALRDARLVVLPGGSPSRLLDALRAHGLDTLLADLLDDGGSVCGSSAGAMVLGERLALPDRGLEVVAGLGLVPGVAVVPHWRGPGPADWLAALLPEPVLVLGVPEQSGVLVTGDLITALGSAGTRLLPEDRELAPGQSTGRVVGGAA